MTHLSISLLGTFQVTSEGAPITTIESDKVRALLAYLAVEANRPHRREALAALLWPDAPQQRARQNLRRALHNLRQALQDSQSETPFLLVSRQDIQFNPASDHWLDVAAFTALLDACRPHSHRRLDACPFCVARLGEAVELYRGDLLDGFTLPDSEPFEEWRLFTQEELHRQATEALTHLATYHERRREYEQAGHYLRRQIELEPWREEAHRQLMRVLALSGRHSAALQQYQACRRILATELGAEPATETTALYQRIQAGELQPELIEAQNPYKGLNAFTEADAADFFGRETFTERLVKAVQRQPLVVVIGPSGSGKSSVVHAGLAPCLRQEDRETRRPSPHPPIFPSPHLEEGAWLTAYFRPGSRPFHRLAEALVPLIQPRLRADAPAIEARVRSMAQLFCDGELRLTDIAARILRQARQRYAGTYRFLLVVDQFEELYALCPDPSTRRAFLDLLLQPPISNPQYPIPNTKRPVTPDTPLSLLISLRADFTAQALSHRTLADGIQSGRLVLGPMKREELRRAIEEPARGRGVIFEPGLVERLLDDVGDEPGNLPLLQFTLTQLWGRQTRGQLTHAAYEEIGGLAGALTRYADGVYEQLSPAEQQDARRVFTRLVRPGEGTEDTRRLASRDELSERDWHLVQRLADARLVVTGREPSGQETVELAHEALIQHWGRLRDWMDADRAFHTWRGRLRAALRQWRASDRDEGALLRGAPLAEAEGWLAEREAGFSPAGREFIRASLALRDEKQRAEEECRQRELAQAQSLAEAEGQRAETEARAGRRLRWLVAGLTALFLIAVGSALLARNAQGKAQRAAQVSQSLNLATSAQLALTEHNTDLALALAVEANRIPEPPPQAQLMLADAAYAPGTRRIFVGHDGPVQDVAIAPDGRTALSASADQTLILWDLETGEMIRRFSGHSDTVHAVAFLPGGDQALSASADGTLILWDLETGDAVRRFTGHSGGVWDVAVNPGGRTALSAGADHTLILWDISAPLNAGIETGDIIRRFSGHEDAVLSVAISPDGDTALSGSADRSVILWDLETGAIRLKIPGVADTVTGATQAIGHFDSVWGVAFLPDGRRALSVSQDENAILWDISAPLDTSISTGLVPSTSSGQALNVAGYLVRRFDADAGLFSLAPSADGRTVLLGTLDNRVLLLDLNTGQISPQLRGHTGRVLAVTFTPGDRIALSGSADGTLRLWDLYNGAEMRRSQYARPPDPAAAAVAISPDGQLGLTGLWTGEICLWDYATGQEIRRLRGHTEMVFGGVHFLPDGRRIVSGAGDIFAAAKDNTVRVWDVETGQELRCFEGHTDKVWDTDVSADGRFVASGSHDGTLRLWDISTESILSADEGLNASIESGEGRVLLDVSPQAVRSVAFSPDGQSLVVGLAKGQASNPEYSLRLLDTETGREIRRLVGHREVVADVAFSPDGKRILSSSTDSNVILWDATSGAEIHRLVGHTSGVLAVAFHPEGRLAVSGATDGSLLLWDIVEGTALRRYVGLTKPVVGLAFVPDGHSFLVAADDDAVHEWRVDATQDDLLAWVAANRHLPKLTCQQREQYRIEPLCEQSGTLPAD